MRLVPTLFLVFCMLLPATGIHAADPKTGTRTHKAPTPPAAMRVTAGALDCSGAVEIALNNTYYGSNIGAPNNVEVYDCAPYYWESGGEVVYHLSLATPMNVEVSISATCDLDLAVLNACDEVAGCVDFAFDTWTSSEPISGDWYFVVDGYYGDECDFSLTVTGTEPPPPPPTPCETAPVLACQNVEFEGTTCDGENFTSDVGPCVSGTPHAGLEDWFKITLAPNGTFIANVSPDQTDAMLLIVDDCSPVNCLASADAGTWVEPEVISYTNNTGATKTVYLVIDSYMADTCGSYLATFTCSGGQVATEASSWGAFKSFYR